MTVPSPIKVSRISSTGFRRNAYNALISTSADDRLDRRMTADQKLRAIHALDGTRLGWSSERWSELLNVSGAAIRNTDWWTTDRKRLIGHD